MVVGSDVGSVRIVGSELRPQVHALLGGDLNGDRKITQSRRGTADGRVGVEIGFPGPRRLRQVERVNLEPRLGHAVDQEPVDDLLHLEFEREGFGQRGFEFIGVADDIGLGLGGFIAATSGQQSGGEAAATTTGTRDLISQTCLVLRARWACWGGRSTCDVPGPSRHVP